MGDGGGMKKHVASEDQHDNDNDNNNNKRKSVTSSSFSSVSSPRTSSGCNSDDDDLITLEDEFLTKASSRSSKQPESSDLTPPADHKLTGGYDSSRIPSAIFSSRPSLTAEWSVASNESLFSIHNVGGYGNGNQSFSKDQALLMYKSGELPRPADDCSSTTQQYNSGLPSVTEVEEPSRRSGFNEMDNNLLVKDDSFGNNKTNGGSKPDDALGNKSEDCHNSVSPHSERSVQSNQSFAFPVFSDELGRNKTVRLQQENQQKSAKKRRQQQQQQQAEKLEEELKHDESPRKPQKASSLSKRNWIPRCSCFSLPCK